MQYNLILLLLVFALGSLCSQDVPPPPPPPPPPPAVDEVFRVVERMPRFPGCEDQGTEEKKKECAQQELRKFIYKHLQYPQEAREKGLEGTSVISFVIEKDGSVTNIEIVRDPGAGMGAAAAAVIRKMPEQGIKWTPVGTRGRPVRVAFNVPVQFRLSDIEEGDASGG